MKVFPVHESDISSLSLLNNLVTLFFSGASATLLFGIGILVDLAIEGHFVAGQTTESGRVLLLVVVPICIVFTVALTLIGFWVRGKRQSIWQKIEDESTECH